MKNSKPFDRKLLQKKPNVLRKICLTTARAICHDNDEFRKAYARKWGESGLRWATQSWPSKLVTIPLSTDVDTDVNKHLLDHVGHKANHKENKNSKIRVYKYCFKQNGSSNCIVLGEATFEENVRLHIPAKLESKTIRWKWIDLEKQYTIRRTLGKGTFGTVYLAFRQRRMMPEMVAIKLLPKHDEEKILKRELASWKRLSQRPNCSQYVVCLHDYGITQYKGKTQIALIMEYLPNSVSLAEFAAQGFEYQPSPDILRHIFKQLTQGLQYIHSRKVYHRDIKSENIMVQSDPKAGWSKPRLKYIDMGLSCVAETDPCQRNVGTPDYMDPLMARRALGEVSGPITPNQLKAADIYALGVTLFEIVYLQHPHLELTEKPPSNIQELFEMIAYNAPKNFEYPPSKELEQQINSLVITNIQQRIKNFDNLPD